MNYREGGLGGDGTGVLFFLFALRRRRFAPLRSNTSLTSAPKKEKMRFCVFSFFRCKADENS